METLTTMETIRLRNLEEIIEKAWTAGGKALIEIRDKRLYRHLCGTFEEYCKERWHKTGRAVRYLIESARAVEELTEKSGKAFPVSQNAARALGNVPQEKRAKVVEVATKNGAITAKSIAEAAKSVVSPKKEKVLDKVGTVIPNEILPLWERKVEFETLAKEMRQLKSRLKNLIHEDPLWRKVSEVASDYAGNIASAIESAMPYAVCMKCGGWFKQTQNGICPPCDNTGFMSKNQYDVWNEDEKRLRKNDNLSRLPSGVSRQNL